MFDVGRSMFDVRRSLVSLSIKLAFLWASGGAHMKLHIVGTANRRMSKDGIALGLRSLFGGVGLLSLFKIDRIHYFDIRYSLFDIRYSLFQSFSFD
jgi:hypothetical protein